MKRILIGCLVAASAWAQAPATGVARRHGLGEMHFLGGVGMRPGQVVTGAPFSGTETTTETQTLSDGTHVQHTITTQFYRDAAGRTRIERTSSSVGPWSGGKPHTMITIYDPVAGTAYMLNPTQQTALKLTIPAGNGAWKNKMQANAVGQASNTELGTQTIAGLNATGTQTTRVIPANTLGNDQAITVTTEKWYSPDLQVNLMTKHTDPRNGTVVTQFSNVVRTPPDPTLFQVPSNFSITTRAPGQRVSSTPANQ